MPSTNITGACFVIIGRDWAAIGQKYCKSSYLFLGQRLPLLDRHKPEDLRYHQTLIKLSLKIQRTRQIGELIWILKVG